MPLALQTLANFDVERISHTAQAPLVLSLTLRSFAVAMRTITIIMYPSPMFPAHWVMWIPSCSKQEVGKAIHTVGDAQSGFEKLRHVRYQA
ncbi:hypothetical protein M405DRAFT_787133 [Rhizopogon salebrosus TDB-379]|nr:hypothetical protein M405DRAFT_787133 [Rhizopogon salebrosus TDB-379]